MNKTIRAADLFCGAGGTSMGLALACRTLKKKVDLLAINHWPVAVETHARNHSWARHLCESIEQVNPVGAVPSGRLHLLVASPECTNHSIARGGRPINDQSRTTAWHILKWAQELYIDNILIENVREFRDWGPIGADCRPLKSKKGQTYRAFLQALRSLGYRVEDRILNAADFGDATTRERLFIIAKRPAHKRIRWPEPSHAKWVGANGFLKKSKPWRAAREIIDWSIPGKSIFNRKRPLADTTLQRIAAGIEKFCGAAAEPFLVILQNNNVAKSVDGPVPTITAQGNKVGLAQPFLVPFYGEREGQKPRTHNVKAPLPTAPASSKFGLVQPFILPLLGIGRGNVPRSINDPIPTILASRGGGCLVEPFVLQQQSCGAPRSTKQPLPTIATKGAQALVEPFIVVVNHGKNKGKRRGNSSRTHSVGKPMKTITKPNGFALVQPMLLKYNRTGGVRSTGKPLDTVTSKDRFGLIEPGATAVGLDIRFRMLQPHELASAMGFPKKYKFEGNRADQVKQIGNAVCVNLSKALCRELLRS